MNLHRIVISFVSAAAVVGITAFVARPGQAQAVSTDKLTLISQERALAGDSIRGDTAGWPITIHRSGTFRLAGDLVVPAGQDAIQVADALDVTIDLNGFQIVGGSACSKRINCYAVNGTSGVRMLGAEGRLTVKNGRIRGFSHAAVSAPTGGPGASRFSAEDLRVHNNGSGIRGGMLIATRLVTADNSGDGAWGVQLAVRDSRFYDNGGCGLVGAQGAVLGSMAAANGDQGFCAGPALVVRTSHAWNNGKGPAGTGAPQASRTDF